MSELDENINQEEENINEENYSNGDELQKIMHVQSMFENWFIEYASYTILDRAVPEIKDGMKPVQRRILHSMWELEDGRYNKVANLIGNTMKYHPHGDASIGDALVQIGQKELLIDQQGNWGNILTGDRAAAPRYIEARLSKFALDVVFNPKTTEWKSSYDGRNKEPVVLPIKFPLLLAQGSEGIAVVLASKILPHNFNELIDASIAILKNKPFEIFPDFLTGGMADVSRYNDGIRGGRVRVRAKISIQDKKTLVITEIPFSTTTSGLIDSIIQANDKGKIKIRKIDDNTAANVEVLVHLSPGISPDQTIDALYAFTDCEVSISPNASVIKESKPNFMGVSDMLRESVANTTNLVKMELEIRLQELENQWHYSSLEKIFIENRIYRDIEECETWEAVLEAIDAGLEPFKHIFFREIVRDDIIRLTEIKIKRISKFDSFKADEMIKNLEFEMEEVKNHLDNLIDYTINYYRQIQKKHGKGRERKTELRSFENIEAQMVAVANQKLYVNREEGFIGTGMKKDDYVFDCSDIDDIIVFRSDGNFLVTKVSDKKFVGKDIIHVDIFKRNDERTIYNMVYSDGSAGAAMVKRFAVLGVTRDKEYDLTKGKKASKVLYFSANPNGESEIIRVLLRPKPKLKILKFDYDFADLAIKGRGSKGNILTKNPVRKIELLEKGSSTLSAIEVWFDEIVMRLNTEERGKYLGKFIGDDRILALYSNGSYKTALFDLSNHYDSGLKEIEKLNEEKPISVLLKEKDSGKIFVKRFLPEINDKLNSVVPDDDNLQFIAMDVAHRPQIEYVFENKKGDSAAEIISVEDFVDVMSAKAKGKRIPENIIKKVKFIEPLEYIEEEEVEHEDEDVPDIDAVDIDEEMEEKWKKEPEKKNIINSKERKQNGKDDDDVIQMSLFED
ncbi:MAG: DNA gyrase/topoisomerase IV subunit A [Bacteroidales bacterium]|nr:DNA gyrase/topoisomerase IV subunit A [Bacteroidales bacterium]MDD4575093.1 DNA gyrase/topoisomerase IV subunit A [Bacteroidales bacterium]